MYRLWSRSHVSNVGAAAPCNETVNPTNPPGAFTTSRRSAASHVTVDRIGGWAIIPASALAGGLLLVCADLFARTLVHYADLPIGMLTALVGGPFFFWLLRRTRRTAGGWA